MEQLQARKLLFLDLFAFKANTNDTRESAAIQICKDLIDEGAEIKIHYPKVKDFKIEKDLQINQFQELEISKENKLFRKKETGDLVKL